MDSQCSPPSPTLLPLSFAASETPLMSVPDGDPAGTPVNTSEEAEGAAGLGLCLQLSQLSFPADRPGHCLQPPAMKSAATGRPHALTLTTGTQTH